MALQADNTSQQEELGMLLEILVTEDPSLKVSSDANTGEIILSGVGELHLESIHDRLNSELRFEISMTRPRVACRESVTLKISHTEHYDVQIGCTSMQASLKLTLGPVDHFNNPSHNSNRAFFGVGQFTTEERKALLEAIASGVDQGPIFRYPTCNITAEVERPELDDSSASPSLVRAESLCESCR